MLKLFVPIVSLSGFFIGSLLAKISPEEMDVGRPFFIWMLRFIVIMTVVGLFYFGEFSVLGLLAGIVLGFFIHEYYFSFGIAIALALGLSDSILLLFGALIYAAGIIHGTLTRSSYRFTLMNVLAKVLFFFLPFTVLLFGSVPAWLSSFAAGSLIMSLFVKNLPKRYKHYKIIPSP